MALAQLGIAATSFAATHFVLSHPLRRKLVRSLGNEVFLLVYSLIALATFGWMVVSFDRTPAGEPLWNGHAPLPWAVASVLTVIATALFLASFYRNPALAGAKLAGLSTVIPKGVFLITRHPMMFGIGIWALAHIIVAPTLRSLILMGTTLLVAIGGAHLQDRKKQALDAKNWGPWMRRTPFWPNIRKAGELGSIWALALALWLLFTWLHVPLAQEPAGVWILEPGSDQ